MAKTKSEPLPSTADLYREYVALSLRYLGSKAGQEFPRRQSSPRKKGAFSKSEKGPANRSRAAVYKAPSSRAKPAVELPVSGAIRLPAQRTRRATPFLWYRAFLEAPDQTPPIQKGAIFDLARTMGTLAETEGQNEIAHAYQDVSEKSAESASEET